MNNVSKIASEILKESISNIQHKQIAQNKFDLFFKELAKLSPNFFFENNRIWARYLDSGKIFGLQIDIGKKNKEYPKGGASFNSEERKNIRQLAQKYKLEYEFIEIDHIIITYRLPE